MRRFRIRKVMSFILMICMCVGLMPVTAVATSRTAGEAINWVKSQVGNSVGYDDGSGYYQCVEFIQAYYEWLGVDSVRGNGADYATNALPSGWTRTAGGIPQKGDILVYSAYSSTVQPYGHVAIYESDNALYDQDGSVYLATVKKESANYRTYTYNYWGCIHPNFAGTASSSSSSAYPTNVKVTTNKSSYQQNETVVISVTGNNYNWYTIHIDKDGQTIYENYDYNTSPINFPVSSTGSYRVTVSACKDWDHFTDAQCSFTVTAAEAGAYFEPWDNPSYTYIRETDAGIGMRVTVTNATPSYVGMVLYDSNEKELARGGESNTYIGPYYFKINEELGYTLTPGTTYKYKFYAVVNGKNCWSSFNTFKTSGTAPVIYSISLDTSSLSLTVGEKDDIIATVTPAGTPVTWSSSNSSVAKVENGRVTAVGAGNATIFATVGGKTATCSVKVNAATPETTVTPVNKPIETNTPEVKTPEVNTPVNNTPVVNTPEVTTPATTGMANLNTNTGTASNVHFQKATIYYQDQFKDVAANQWYTDSVASAFELGLMKGNSNTTFSPFGDVTVAEAITMAARIHSIATTGTENFIQSGKWYQVYLDYAYKNGIISTAFYNSDVTHKANRAQFAQILANSLSDANLAAINQISDNAVPDVNMNADYASGVYKLYRAGVLTGSDANGSFSPSSYITRAEAAAIVSRMAESNNRKTFSL